MKKKIKKTYSKKLKRSQNKKKSNKIDKKGKKKLNSRFNFQNITEMTARVIFTSIAISIIIQTSPTVGALNINPLRALQSSSSTAASNSFTPNSTTNCTVDKCILCVDNTSLTCTQCDSGWYKKTFKGGFKSYDVCWSIWKLILMLLGLCCLATCCGLGMYICKRIGQTGKIFGGINSAPA